MLVGLKSFSCESFHVVCSFENSSVLLVFSFIGYPFNLFCLTEIPNFCRSSFACVSCSENAHVQVLFALQLQASLFFRPKLILFTSELVPVFGVFGRCNVHFDHKFVGYFFRCFRNSFRFFPCLNRFCDLHSNKRLTAAQNVLCWRKVWKSCLCMQRTTGYFPRRTDSVM